MKVDSSGVGVQRNEAMRVSVKAAAIEHYHTDLGCAPPWIVVAIVVVAVRHFSDERDVPMCCATGGRDGGKVTG